MSAPRRQLRIGRVRRPALTTKEGWRAFVNEPLYSASDLFGDRENWRKLARADQAAFDQRRFDHHGRFVLETAWMSDIYDNLQSQVETNYGAVGARPGSVIDAEAGNYGKTWTMTNFARWYELQLRATGGRRMEIPGANDDYVPVVYVALRRDSTTTQIDRDILGFYGSPPGRHVRVGEYASHVAQEAHECDTSLILIDDIHKLRRWRDDDVSISHHLNFLATAVPATFVYAGIRCVESGVFSEGGGGFVVDASSTSTQGRFTHLEIEAFDLDEKWQSLLADFEDELVLLKAEEGMLYDTLAEYLFDRTSGVLGSISQLLRRGANRAIATGAEKLTKSLLKSVTIDEAARRRERVETAGSKR